MPRKILIDGTPGVDMAIALSIAMFHPELELVAATSIGGRLPEGTAAINLHGLVEFLDPPKLPRIGVGTGPVPEMRDLWRRFDYLNNAHLPDVERLAPCSADRVIIETARSTPREVTVITCGPLTNLLRAFQRDPELPSLLRRVVIAGGAVLAPGDVTPMAEFNIFADPMAAAEVVHSTTTKQLVPLDVTAGCELSREQILSRCLSTALRTRVGQLLQWILLPNHQDHDRLDQDQDLDLELDPDKDELNDELEYIACPGTIAMMTVLAPRLFQIRQMSGDVEVNDGLCVGTTVFDRREPSLWPGNIDVVHDFAYHETTNSRAWPVLQLIYEAIEQAARQTSE